MGKPIIAYSIETALNSGLFSEVMVSTDDDEIANISTKYGALVPFKRSKETASDVATTVDVLIEVINNYEAEGKKIYKACCLYPTAPLINIETLRQAYAILTKNNFDCVFPVVRFGFPIQRALIADNDGKVKMIHPEHLTTRSQDLEPTFHDAGQFYFFDVEKIRIKKKLWTNNTGFVEVSELNAQDIDTATDWKLTELKYKLIHGFL